jgi:hypothetical protein
MSGSRQPTEEEARQRRLAEDVAAGNYDDLMVEELAWGYSAALDTILAQRDVVAAQDKALRRIAAIKDQHTWSEDDALEAAEIAAAVVSGTPGAKP